MMKHNKGKLILSSVLILLPVLVGMLLWNKLPETVAIHWGIDGAADGFGSRATAVFFLPLILLGLHWVGLFATANDHRGRAQSEKIIGMTFWLCPIISIFASAMTYALALGHTLHMSAWLFVGLGVVFVLIGNYMPKCRQNHTIGLKIRWTLANEENWNATHRFAGKIWVIGGFLFALCAFLPMKAIPWALIIMILILVVLPVSYSWRYYQKQAAEGLVPKKAQYSLGKGEKKVVIGTVIGLVILFVFLSVVLFTGDIEVTYEETSFTVSATYYGGITVAYADIDAIEYRDSDDAGSRIYGYGSPRLLAGAFQNEEFDKYTRYSYTFGEACIVVTVDDNILVIGGKDAADTKAIFDAISAHCEK